jgi:hypothetical protein
MKENQGKQSFPSLKMFLYFEGKHIYCQGITEGNGFIVKGLQKEMDLIRSPSRGRLPTGL